MSAAESSSLCWVLLSVSLLVSADQINIKAEPGQSVTLPCGAYDNNNPVTAVEWSRPDLEPQYVLFYQEDFSYPENQHPSFRNRVDLRDRQMKNGDVSLFLRNVRTEDSGIYECSVLQRGDKHTWKRDTFNTEPIRIINLSVGSAADEGMRNDEGTNAGGDSSRSVAQEEIKAKPGQKVILPCKDLKTPQEGNIIVVEWRRNNSTSGYVLRYRDDQLDEENQDPSFNNRVDLQNMEMVDGNVSLVLRKVRAEDSGTYECQVQREKGTKNIICTIQLDVASPPTPAGADGLKRNGCTSALVLLSLLLLVFLSDQ